MPPTVQTFASPISLFESRNSFIRDEAAWILSCERIEPNNLYFDNGKDRLGLSNVPAPPSAPVRRCLVEVDGTLCLVNVRQRD